MLRHKTFSVFVFAFLFFPFILYSQNETPYTIDVQPSSGHIVIVQWTNAAESDTVPFEVERSRDKITWERIARVPAQISHQYFTIDSDPGEGIIYYRVKRSVNADDYSLSATKWVKMCETEDLYIWPNASRDVIYVKTPFVNGSMDVLDPDGKLMMKMPITNFLTGVPTACLSKGTYFLHIRYDNEMLVEKVVKD